MLWWAWQQSSITITALVTHVAKVTKISWHNSQEEEDPFFLLTGKLMPAAGKAMGDLAGGELGALLHPVVLCGRAVLTQLYQRKLHCLGLLPKIRRIFPCSLTD